MSKTRIVVAALLLSLVVAPAYASDGHQEDWSVVGWLGQHLAALGEVIADVFDDDDDEENGSPDLGPFPDPIG